jgi:hypothetical protein
MRHIQNQLRVLPFFLVGAIAFSINSSLDINPYLQFYLTLLEAQGGIFLLIYVVGIQKKFKAKN